MYVHDIRWYMMCCVSNKRKYYLKSPSLKLGWIKFDHLICLHFNLLLCWMWLVKKSTIQYKNLIFVCFQFTLSSACSASPPPSRSTAASSPSSCGPTNHARGKIVLLRFQLIYPFCNFNSNWNRVKLITINITWMKKRLNLLLTFII